MVFKNIEYIHLTLAIGSSFLLMYVQFRDTMGIAWRASLSLPDLGQAFGLSKNKKMNSTISLLYTYKYHCIQAGDA